MFQVLCQINDVINSGIYDVDATDTIQSLSGSGSVIELAGGITLLQVTQEMIRFQAWFLVPVL